jgi:hypothetical protein
LWSEKWNKIHEDKIIELGKMCFPAEERPNGTQTHFFQKNKDPLASTRLIFLVATLFATLNHIACTSTSPNKTAFEHKISIFYITGCTKEHQYTGRHYNTIQCNNMYMINLTNP